MPVRRIMILLLFALVGYAPLIAQDQKPACSAGNIKTSYGPVCGKSSAINLPQAGPFTANAYLGIPYAQPPVGALRWQSPVSPKSWTRPYQATQFGNECPQTATLTRKGCGFTTSDQDEDCLYLNVWTPAGATPASKLQVLVFIHGGAFITGAGGSSTSDLPDGTYLAASQNIVVVTLNYRLGVLGFLATADMPSGAGNFGFRDQLMALNWVQQNIAGFGGDPGQVTIFGESAGAMSVGLHALSSPQSAGLFKAALMESNLLGLPYKTLQQAQRLGQIYSQRLKCSDLGCLRRKSACELVARESLLPPPTSLSTIFNWTPVIDGSLITGQPIASAGNLKVPVLMGTNRDEGTVFSVLWTQPDGLMPEAIEPQGYSERLCQWFGPDNALKIVANSRYSCSSAPCTTPLANVITDYVFTCANRHLALQAGGSQSLYMYLFNQPTSFNFWASPNPRSVPECQGQVCHADELPYVFNTALAACKAFQPAEEALSMTMGGYWASFAKSQSPGSAWPLFNPDKTYLMLNENSSPANDPLDTTANCSALWDGIGYQSGTWSCQLTGAKASPKKQTR